MIDVNLFDSNFPGSPSSVMGKTPWYIHYVRDQMEFDGVTIFTDEHINSETVDQVVSRYKIAWLHEPYCLHPQTYRRAFFNIHKFDLTMTYYRPFLALKKTVFCPYGGIWIPRDMWNIQGKQYPVSMLYGDKMSTDGHKIRHEIAESIKENSIYNQQAHLFHNIGYSWDAKFRTLAPYYFSIVTETCREDNEFTEWLLDCFIMKTIPIFWGCPNIGDFFNADGVLSFETYREGIDHLESLIYGNAADIYFSKINAVDDNFYRAQEYEITEDWFYINVLQKKGLMK